MTSIESALKPFFNEAQVEAAPGVTLRLVMNFRTIDLLEGLLGRGMDELLGDLATSTGLMGKFIWAMSREHHSELSVDQIAGIMFTPEYGPAMAAIAGDLIKRSFHVSEVGEGEQGSRPPKRSAGASRSSSRNGSRQGSARAASGRKRRARSS